MTMTMLPELIRLDLIQEWSSKTNPRTYFDKEKNDNDMEELADSIRLTAKRRAASRKKKEEV